jgi:hypothetical protein
MKWTKASVQFCRLYHALGEMTPGEIKIDLKRNANPVHTYLHELLHNKHPEWSETKVMRTERKLWKRLTQKQAYLLGKRLFNRKWKTEE